MEEHDFPVTLGRDFAGFVEQVGSDVSRYRLGDEVYGFLPAVNPSVHDGSWSELITVPEDDFVTPKPRSLEPARAGAAPLAGITALAARDALAPTNDQTILVIGATGGVGSFFVQLASNAGAHVVAPAFPEDEGYLRELGADEILDRNADLETTFRERHENRGRRDPRRRLLRTARIAAERRRTSRLAAWRRRGRPAALQLVAQPTPKNLQRLGELLDDGTLRVHLQKTYELADAADALQELSNNHTQGKLGLAIT
jgi:NADPH2:quinone reductase